jgi:hypothetical protein
MIAIVWLFIHLLIWAIVLGLLYKAAVAIVGVTPPPFQPFARAAAVVLICLLAILILLGEVGVIADAPWRYSAHRGW